MIALDKPIIKTPRFTLRPWRESDLAPFAAMNADPQVMRHFPKMLTRQESDATVEFFQTHFTRHGFSLFSVELAATGDFLGFVGLAVPSFQAHFTPCVEIGWRIRSEFQGRGYATEAARAVLRFGFEQIKLQEIVSFTVPANERSWKLMERLGMTRNPADDFDHPKLPPDHPLRRHILYRISKNSWINGNSRLPIASNPQ